MLLCSFDARYAIIQAAEQGMLDLTFMLTLRLWIFQGLITDQLLVKKVLLLLLTRSLHSRAAPAERRISAMSR